MMTSAVSKLGAVVIMAFSMMFAVSPSVASSTVATTGTTTTPPMPRTVSATSPCQSGPVTIPVTHVPVSGLVEVDLDTHRRFRPFGYCPWTVRSPRPSRVVSCTSPICPLAQKLAFGWRGLTPGPARCQVYMVPW